ncbi:MAG: glycosyltransferase family 9 protein [Desulfobacteraceae bacterium]
MKILVIKLGALGDVINTFPVVVNIQKHFSAEIHWLVAPLSRPLVSAHHAVTRTIVFDKTRLKENLPELLRNLRETDYDVIIDFQRILKSGLFCLAAKGKRRIGFDRKRCKEMTFLLPFERIPPGDPGSHMLMQYMEFGRYLGVPCEHTAWEIPRFKNNVSGLPPRYAVLNIGATKAPNQWPPHSFAELADLIYKAFHIPCVITGGPGDQDRAAVVKNLAQTEVLDLAGRTTVSDLVEVIARAECVITSDTGPMHLASALGTRLVALFGPSDPSRTGPFRGEVLQRHVPCGPCNKKKCSNPVCMDQIRPGDVMDRLSEMLRV